MAQTETPSHPSAADLEVQGAPVTPIGRLVRRVSAAEVVIAGVVVVVLALLVLIEPEILEAPIENADTVLFTVGATSVAALALVAMLWFGVPAVVRIPVLLVPFVAVSWWLLSPYFIDDVVDEEFSTSIAAQVEDTADGPDAGGSAAPAPSTVDADPADPQTSAPPTTAPPTTGPAVPVLLGVGQFRGLAGHSGTGDAGVFENPDGSLILRFENFDIQNGPDLEVYFVPGADQVDLVEGSIHLGALKGNVGDQSYDLPPATDLAPGSYTALVWCEAFSVEFVGATIALG